MLLGAWSEAIAASRHCDGGGGWRRPAEQQLQLAPEASRRALATLAGRTARIVSERRVRGSHTRYACRALDLDPRASRTSVRPSHLSAEPRAREARQMPAALTALCNYDQLKGKRPTRSK
eukprot:scaffold27056_cov94-Phaeocystis_antarctica.AAC.2